MRQILATKFGYVATSSPSNHNIAIGTTWTVANGSTSPTSSADVSSWHTPAKHARTYTPVEIGRGFGLERTTALPIAVDE